MSFTCNASLGGGCSHELNRQLQGLQSRMKTLERSHSTHQTLTILGLIKTIAAFIASGQATAAAILSADPSIAQAILGAAGWQALMDMIPGLDFTAVLGEIAMANLSLEPFDDLLVSAIADSIGAALADAENALADAIASHLPADVIADLQAKVLCFNIQLGAVGGFKAAQNRLTKCGTAKMLYSAATA